MKNVRNPRIAFVTLADLPLPAIKGGAVENLIDILCDLNEQEQYLDINVYSIDGVEDITNKVKTKYYYYSKKKDNKISVKNIVFKINGHVILNRTMKQIVKHINKENYDLVIVTSIIKEIYAFTNECNAPVIWYLHGDAVEVLGQKWVYQITELCKGIIAVSDFVGNQIKNTGTNTPVYVVKNCTDIVPIDDIHKNEIRLRFRKKYGIDNEIVFAYIGRIVPIKGVLELIIAFSEANKPNSKLIIVGNSDKCHEIYFQEAKKRANKNVIFIGYIPHNELNQVYCGVDVVVVPSICNEAASLAVVEAQYCEKYVIAANRGGIKEYANSSMTNLVEGSGKLFIENLKKSIQMYDMNMKIQKKCEKLDFSPLQFYKSFIKCIYDILNEE